jgi:hypothetical protein
VSDHAQGPQWFTVRCIFQLKSDAEADFSYEERLTLWRAESIDDAIRLAEAEASDYETENGSEYLGMAQAFHLFDPPEHGAEVFSLIRESDLEPEAYLDGFFDTGRESQRDGEES